jgi:hypothetical protein
MAEVNASPCILTLIISFILSDYILNVLEDKLKAYKIIGWF